MTDKTDFSMLYRELGVEPEWPTQYGFAVKRR